ncbi:cytochrome c biogenesis CcdA family protein [Streptomyces tendae]
MDIGYLGAFLGGVLSLLSPCSAMLLPAFFAYAFSTPSTLIARTGAFYLGLITTLVPLGVFAGTIGAFLSTNRSSFLTVVAGIVFVFGIVQFAGLPVPGLVPRRSKSSATGSAWTVYVLGTAYGVAGACTGPILGSVLVVAAAGATPLYGAILLALYAVGMALPLLALALGWKRWSRRLHAFLTPREVRIGRWTNSWNAIIAGSLSILLGLVMLLIAQDPEAGGLVPIAIEYQIEISIQKFAQDVPNSAVFGVVTGIAIPVVLWRRRRKGVSNAASVSSDADSSTPGSDSTCRVVDLADEEPTA